jgi:hypothetical protein
LKRLPVPSYANGKDSWAPTPVAWYECRNIPRPNFLGIIPLSSNSVGAIDSVPKSSEVSSSESLKDLSLSLVLILSKVRSEVSENLH